MPAESQPSKANTASVSPDEQPFARLDAHTVLDALEAIGLRCDGRLQALNSFENRVYLVGLEDGSSLVAKFYRPGRWTPEQLREEHQFAHDIAAAEIPLAAPLARPGSRPGSTRAGTPQGQPAGGPSSKPPNNGDETLFFSHGFAIALYARQGGRVPELDNVRDGPAMRERIGQFIARIHQVGARQPFLHRPPLDGRHDGWASVERVIHCPWLPPELRGNWEALARQCCERIEARLNPPEQPFRQIRLHGDCHLGNLLWTDAHGPHFVDLDDSRMGPAIQDLWMLADAAGQQADEAADAHTSQAMSELLAGYEQIRPFDRRELGLIEALRTLRIIRHSAWLAERWNDPAFPAAFPWFGSARYWQGQILHLQEQLDALASPVIH
ncbi:MAG: serine/threonine protein kinase [Lautropia sp.]|nr:serine/threonine protein kinase [Lautropia sp.]